MKPHMNLSAFDTLSLAEKRAAILLGFRWRDRTRRAKALAELPLLRKRLAHKSKGFSGAACIRRLRDAR